MKTLVVYYSLEGNAAYVADKITAATGADQLRLVPKKAYSDKGLAKFFWGGKSAVMGERPALEPYDVDLSSYDRIVLGFPVWAGTFTPPLRTFVADHKRELAGKHVSAYACQSGSGGEKALAKLRAFAGIDAFEQEAILIDPKEKSSPETDAKIDAFCSGLQKALGGGGAW
jgi:flavodoxin